METRLLDQLYHDLRTTKGPNVSVPWVLMASYLYYHEDKTILSDVVYDSVIKDIVEHWDEIDHCHKRFLDFESLKSSSTMFQMKSCEYPLITISTAHRLLARLTDSAIPPPVEIIEEKEELSKESSGDWWDVLT